MTHPSNDSELAAMYALQMDAAKKALRDIRVMSYRQGRRASVDGQGRRASVDGSMELPMPDVDGQGALHTEEDVEGGHIMLLMYARKYKRRLLGL
jgi:hypothetical protein